MGYKAVQPAVEGKCILNHTTVVVKKKKVDLMKCQSVLFAKLTHSLSAKANVNFFITSVL